MDLGGNIRQNLQFYFLILLLVVFGGVSLFVVWQYVGYMLAAAVLSFLTYPVYEYVKRKVEHEDAAAFIVIVGLMVVFVIPLIAVSGILVQEAQSFVQEAELQSGDQLEQVESTVESVIGGNVEVKDAIVRSVADLSGVLQENLASLVGAVANFFIGIAVMLFLMFYLYKEGPRMAEALRNVIPMEDEYRDHLFTEVDHATKGVMLGHVFTAFIQGVFAALGFLLFGVEHALLWGFVTLILAVIPMIGPFIIYLPIGIAFIYQGNVVSGVLLLVYGFGFVSTIDNVVRPYLTSHYIDIHPAVILLSMLGGLSTMGAIGLFLGPLFFALFIALLRTYQQTVIEPEY